MKREALVALDACYAFVIAHPGEPVDAWPSVLHEVWQVRGMLLLLRCNLCFLAPSGCVLRCLRMRCRGLHPAARP
eukprot:2899497-Pyramimonas_sp.AAC.1